MKQIFLLLFTLLFSLQVFPNDKGNGLDNEQRRHIALDIVLEQGLLLQEITYPELAKNNFDLYTPSHLKMKPFTTVVSELLKLEQFELLRSVTVEDPMFYEAFRMKEGITAQERNLALSFWLTLKASVEKQATPEAWEIFISSIDENRLGFKLP
jgi:hypothetical protein